MNIWNHIWGADEPPVILDRGGQLPGSSPHERKVSAILIEKCREKRTWGKQCLIRQKGILLTEFRL